MKTRLLLILIFVIPCYTHAQVLSKAELHKSLLAFRNSDFNTVRIDLALVLADHYISKNGESPTDLDSAIVLLDRAQALSARLKYTRGLCYAPILYAKAYREKGETARGITYCRKAISLAADHSRFIELGDAYLELTQYYSLWDAHDRSIRIEILKKTDSVFFLSGDKGRQAFTLKHLADHYQFENDYPLAIKILKRALQLQEEIGDPRKHGVYDLLGYCYLHLSDYENALRYGLLAEETAAHVQDTSVQLCTIFNRIGITYIRMNKFSHAFKYFERALGIAKKYHDHHNLYIVAVSSMLYYHLTGKHTEGIEFLQALTNSYAIPPDQQLSISNCFLKLYTHARQYEQANRYAAIFTSTAENIQYARENPVVMNNMLTLFIRTAQLEEADTWIRYHDLYQATYQAARQAHRRYNLLFRYQLDSIRGDYVAALASYQKFKTLDDSILQFNKKNQLIALEIEYESIQKDQDLKLKEQSIDLLTKQSEIQTQSIQQSYFTRNVTLAGAGLLVVFLVFLYRQYKIKRKTNNELLVQENEIRDKTISLQELVQEKEWLLQEVHHRVKNNLQTVLSLLYLHARQLSDEAHQAIQESHNRVYAMSLIHKKLYQSADNTSINIHEYLHELTENLAEFYQAKRKATIQLYIDSFFMDVSEAVPVGLIVNEAVSNALGYAFPKFSTRNFIRVKLSRENGTVRLVIEDNGIGSNGLPGGWKSESGLGIKLIREMTMELHGELEITSGKGFTIMIVFQLKR